MKKRNLFWLIGGSILPLIALTSSICPTHDVALVKDEPVVKRIKAIPFENRYSNLDILNEPESKKSFDYNFNHMNLGGTDIASSTVWENYRGKPVNENEKVTVAIIDSGIDIYHEDFLKESAKGVILNESNILDYSILNPKSCYIHDPKSTGYIKDVVVEPGILKAYDTETKSNNEDGSIEYYSHGTACASVLGGRINGMGGFGLAPLVDIMMIKIDFWFNSLDVAIRYAADNGADVISLSLGSYSESFKDGFGDDQKGEAEVATYLQSACDYAESLNCNIVAAAGNELTDHKSYPACNKNVIGVGALEEKSGTEQAFFSNYNKSSDTKYSNNNVDVMAPGVVYSANVPQIPPRKGSNSKLADSYYSITQGTSFSCPLTAGAVALYKAKNPNATSEEVRQALNYSCVDIGEPGWDSQFGFGRVDVDNLLQDSVKVTEVKVNPNKIELIRSNENPYPTATLKAEILPIDASENYKKGLWISDNEDVVTVDEITGVIKAAGEGTTNVSFVTEMDMIVGSCEVSVKGHVDLIETTDSLTIGVSNHALKGNTYNWHPWTSNGVTGESFVYSGTKNKLQFNMKKTSYYSYNNTAVPGNIKSITLKGEPSLWTVATSKSSFGQLKSEPVVEQPIEAKQINANGVTFELNSTDSYFAVIYQGANAGYLYEIIVNYVSLQVPPKTVTLDKNIVNLTIGETASLTATANGDVTWTNSNPSVASFENNIITALASGTTTITVTNGDATASCVVNVKADYDLQNIRFEGEIPAKVPFKGKIDLSKIKVIASYSNNEPEKEVIATFDEIDTNSIGEKTLTARYSEFGITKTCSAKIFVTNENATRTETINPSKTNNAITSSTNFFDGENGTITGDEKTSWKLSLEKTISNKIYTGFNHNDNGSQIGSKNGYPTRIDVTSNSYQNKVVEKIVISTKSENATLKVSVNGVPYKCNGNESVKASYIVKDYIFEGNEKGLIDINYSNIEKHTIISSIKVTYRGGITYSWSGDEQAASFVNYLKQVRTCAGDWTNRDQIVTLVKEYNAMLQDSKNSKVLLESFDDHGVNTTALNKLMKIVDQYNNSLQENETKLSLILSENENGVITEIYETNQDNVSMDSDLAIVLYTIIAAFIVSLGFIITIKSVKRREN